MNKAKVLFFSADPLSIPYGRNPPLRLAEEIRQIRRTVSAGTRRIDLELDYRPAARPDDLLQALIDTRPQVVHFSGHGERKGLILMDPTGRNPHRIDEEGLKRLFQLFRGDIRVVVLNACHSLPLAKAIADIVGCAIGNPGEIEDPAAIAFGASFYRGLACGHPIKTAFDHACTAFALEHPGKEPPELVTGRGVNARRRNVKPSLPRAIARIATVAAFPVVSVVAIALAHDGDNPPPGCGWDWGSPRVVADAPGTLLLETPRVPGPQADLAAGKLLAGAGNHAQAFQLFERAARAGNAEAMGYLGTAYLRGLGTPRQPELGFRWVHEAATKRDARAMNELGVAYQNGQGTKASRRWARHWYQAAAEQKAWPDAMLNLAKLYRDEQHYGLALMWYRAAVRAGMLDAAVEAGDMYQQGQGVSPNVVQARCLYQTAADGGSPLGMFAMGRSFQYAVGVGPDYAEAMEWYQKAAAAGSVDAMVNIGMMYQNGWGVSADRAKAIQWYTRARAAGSLVAPWNLRYLGVS